MSADLVCSTRRRSNVLRNPSVQMSLRFMYVHALRHESCIQCSERRSVESAQHDREVVLSRLLHAQDQTVRRCMIPDLDRSVLLVCN